MLDSKSASSTLGMLVQPSEKELRNFLQSFEWLGTLGMARWRYGLKQDGGLAAVVGFGPVGSHTAFSAMLPGSLSKSVVQLVRGASAPWAHPHSASYLIAAAGRELFRLQGTTLLAAFADPRAGEVGTIYQACNAIYVGMTSTGGAEAFIVHGRRYTARRAYEHFGSTAHAVLRKIDPDAKQVPRGRKHRYLIPIGDKRSRRQMRRLLEPYRTAYPKDRQTPTMYKVLLERALPLRED